MHTGTLFMAFGQGITFRRLHPSLAFGEAGLSCLWPLAKRVTEAFAKGD